MPDASTTDVLLIGGGIAASSAARTLREGGFTGSIVLATRELDPPYHRPPGSKDHLRGESSMEDAHVLPESWYAENDVDLRTKCGVLSLDADAKTVKLQTKEQLTYGKALLATGAMVRRLMVDGSNLTGIHYLRSLRNAEAIRKDLEVGARVVLVGGSYVGCEVAASLTELGHPVTVLMQEDEPLQRTFGKDVGGWIRARLEGKGVVVRGGVEVSEFVPTEGTPEDAEDPRVGGVKLADGEVVTADLVVIGVGATPDASLAKRAKLDLGESGGVKCDDRLRTSADGLWAAGDVCEYESELHGGPTRIEHEVVAEEQGAFVARSWLGTEEGPYREVPYFFSDLSDWVSLESLGPIAPWDATRIEGSLDDDAFAVWLLAGDREVGYAAFNGAGDLDAAKAKLGA